MYKNLELNCEHRWKLLRVQSDDKREILTVETERINMEGRRKRNKYRMQNKEGMEINKDKLRIISKEKIYKER